MRLPDDVRALIDVPNFAHLAVVTGQGPHVSPVWVDHGGSAWARRIDDLADQHPDAILVNTAEGRLKVHAVRADPRVGLSITANDDPYVRTVVRGHVVELRHDGAHAHIDAMSEKYRGNPKYPLPEGQQRVIVVIEADHLAR